MGFKYRDAVWNHLRGKVPPLELLVLMEIADRTNGDRPLEAGAWPSLKTIAEALGVSRSTAKRAVHSLTAADLLLTEHRERQPSVYRLGPRVTETLGWGQPDPGVGSERPGGRVTLTPEPWKRTLEENPSPPSSPQGGEAWERDPLFEEWNRVAETGKKNPCLTTSRITARKKTQLALVRRVAKYLSAHGRTWDDLRRGFEAYELGAGMTPKNCTIERLAANESIVAAMSALGERATPQPIPPWKGDDR